MQPPPETAAIRVVDLRGMNGALAAQFMLDDFVNQPKHDVFRVRVSKDDKLPEALTIDNVNGKAIDPISLMIIKPELKDGVTSATAEVSTKVLVKYFVKGINRFEISYLDKGDKQSTEVIMNVQM